MSTLLKTLDTGEQIGFHAEITASSEISNKVASHPVSGRTPSSDHIEREARTYDFQVVTTDSPIGPQVTLEDVVGLSLETAIIDYLIRNQTKYFTVVSSRVGVLGPLALVRATPKWDVRRLCSFDLTFREVTFVESARARLPPRRVKKPGVEPPKPEAKCPTTPVNSSPTPGGPTDFASELFLTTGNNPLVSPAKGSPIALRLDAYNARRAEASSKALTADVNAITGAPTTPGGAAVRNNFLASGPTYKAPSAANNFVEIRK